MKTLAESVPSERLLLSEGLRSIWGCVGNDELLKAVNTFGGMCFPPPLNALVTLGSLDHLLGI